MGEFYSSLYFSVFFKFSKVSYYIVTMIDIIDLHIHGKDYF